MYILSELIVVYIYTCLYCINKQHLYIVDIFMYIYMVINIIYRSLDYMNIYKQLKKKKRKLKNGAVCKLVYFTVQP